MEKLKKVPKPSTQSRKISKWVGVITVVTALVSGGVSALADPAVLTQIGPGLIELLTGGTH